MVFVFAHAEVVGLDEFDEVLALDDAARKLHLFAADKVQVVAEEHNDLVDFGIGGIVSQHDILIPNELALSGFDLLWGWQDMGVLREGVKAEKAEENEDLGFHKIVGELTMNWKFGKVITISCVVSC